MDDEHQRMSKIKVSVIVPCFRAGAFLNEAVASALQQQADDTDLEVIVVDDRSDDAATHEALAAVARLDRVRVLENSGPKGSAAARNAGISAAAGNWIAFLDADDWMLPASIQRRLSALRLFPDIEWIGGDFDEVFRDGQIEHRGRFERNLDVYSFLRPAYVDVRQPIRLARPINQFLHQTPTNTITSMMTRRLFLSVDGYDERLLRQQDYHLFLRLAATADFAFVPALVARVRHHENNSTRSLCETQVWRIEALKQLTKAPELASLKGVLAQKIAMLHLANAYHHRNVGNFGAALADSWRALAGNPASPAAWRCLAASLLRRP